RFLATQQHWIQGKEATLKFQLYDGQGDRALPPCFEAIYGHELGAFHLDYSSNNESSSPDVMILFGSKPSELQDSSDKDEVSTMEGNNPNNPIIMSDETNSIIELSEDISEREEIAYLRYNPEVSYRKRLTSTDVTGSRL
ncbi:hypothetical protein S245_043391, partial [Arachis hypogaea]